jgi:DNA-binding ferritin-like protein
MLCTDKVRRKTMTKSLLEIRVPRSDRTLQRDLKRHTSSLTVLAYHYQSHLPHLAAPRFSGARDLFLSFAKGLGEDLKLLTRRIREIGAAPMTAVEEIEQRAYLPLLNGDSFDLGKVVRKELQSERRLRQMLEHTINLARRYGDETTACALQAVLNKAVWRAASLERLFAY